MITIVLIVIAIIVFVMTLDFVLNFCFMKLYLKSPKELHFVVVMYLIILGLLVVVLTDYIQSLILVWKLTK